MQSGLSCKGPVHQALGQGSMAAGVLPAARTVQRLTANNHHTQWATVGYLCPNNANLEEILQN